jgi:polyhydroxyalkanoate synthesis regulator phasin
MNDLIRTTLYTGAGTMVLAKAKLQEFIEDLIQNNELTQEEGQRVILQAINAMEDKKNAWEAQFYKSIDSLLLALKLPVRTDIEAKINAFITTCTSTASIDLFKKSTDHRPTKAS